jgi:hypothetical protein
MVDGRWQMAHEDLRSSASICGPGSRYQVLRDDRAVYGEEILSTLSRELESEFGRGFSWPNLSRMMAFAETFPDEKHPTFNSQPRSDGRETARRRRDEGRAGSTSLQWPGGCAAIADSKWQREKAPSRSDAIDSDALTRMLRPSRLRRLLPSGPKGPNAAPARVPEAHAN